MTATDASAAVFGSLFGILLFAALYVWSSLAFAAVFRKSGEEPWKAWVPILNAVVLLQLAGLSPWLLLVAVVPFLGWIALVVVFAIAFHRLSAAFGFGVGMTVLGVVLSPVWASVVGWGSARWLGRESVAGVRRTSAAGAEPSLPSYSAAVAEAGEPPALPEPGRPAPRHAAPARPAAAAMPAPPLPPAPPAPAPPTGARTDDPLPVPAPAAPPVPPMPSAPRAAVPVAAAGEAEAAGAAFEAAADARDDAEDVEVSAPAAWAPVSRRASTGSIVAPPARAVPQEGANRADGAREELWEGFALDHLDFSAEVTGVVPGAPAPISAVSPSAPPSVPAVPTASAADFPPAPATPPAPPAAAVPAAPAVSRAPAPEASAAPRPAVPQGSDDGSVDAPRLAARTGESGDGRDGASPAVPVDAVPGLGSDGGSGDVGDSAGVTRPPVTHVPARHHGAAPRDPWAPPAGPAEAEAFPESSGPVSAIAGAPDAGAPRSARSSVSAFHTRPEIPENDDIDSTVIARRKRTDWALVPPVGDPIPLAAEVVLVGRRPVADPAHPGAQLIAIADGTVSKTHARLRLQGDRWYITDLDSTNGVLFATLMGTEVEATPGVEVEAGDRFLLGDAEVRLIRSEA